MTFRARLLPLGDTALLLELGAALDETAFAAVRSAAVALGRDPIPGVHEVVSAYTGIALHYDPLVLTYRDACDAVRERLLHAVADAQAASRVVEVPVRYGGTDGPDLHDLALHTGLTIDEVVGIHTAGTYTVRMIGFAPGFPYLSGMDPRLSMPRRASPRERVAAGSVGIAGAQTGIYPAATPGGWNIIGRTTLPLFDAAVDPPILLRVGDNVRFVPVKG